VKNLCIQNLKSNKEPKKQSNKAFKQQRNKETKKQRTKKGFKTMSESKVCLLFPKPLKTGAWSERERETLQLHVTLLGPRLDLIAKSMNRSRGSIVNQLRDEKRRNKSSYTY
tara:strand:- start:462 stop:797 length:336 start_codon:yes stop_codon:yes gene_type:complete